MRRRRRLKFLDVPGTPLGVVILSLILGAALIAGYEAGSYAWAFFR